MRKPAFLLATAAVAWGAGSFGVLIIPVALLLAFALATVEPAH